MITLPAPYIATRYPGYFWNIETRTLYSLKVGGVLKELRSNYASKWNNWTPSYSISHHGERRHMTLRYLNKLRLVDSVIPEYCCEREPLTHLELESAIYDFIETTDWKYRKKTLKLLERDFYGRYSVADATAILTQLGY